ncbi:unnamed protein product [Paramecium pentaurelia]|uniref:Uncharacterized protein n=1 Tax=Paramecium pentaurelia TaxID=43138 RepID=A0A8S1RYS8_9CILI|nr:unnamed protein product [Paramecium pentaurelia]
MMEQLNILIFQLNSSRFQLSLALVIRVLIFMMRKLKCYPNKESFNLNRIIDLIPDSIRQTRNNKKIEPFSQPKSNDYKLKQVMSVVENISNTKKISLFCIII